MQIIEEIETFADEVWNTSVALASLVDRMRDEKYTQNNVRLLDGLARHLLLQGEVLKDLAYKYQVEEENKNATV